MQMTSIGVIVDMAGTIKSEGMTGDTTSDGIADTIDGIGDMIGGIGGMIGGIGDMTGGGIVEVGGDKTG
jgi:hypothetical protein